MHYPKHILFFLFLCGNLIAQTNTYEISFENAVHHEAFVKGSFPDIKNDTIAFRMSRTSPGRYALHEFAKNVYAFTATDSKGKALTVTRPNPYQWNVSGHDGTVNISYTLFANWGDGTYSQVDETHAHLNIPATFMYAPILADRKIEINFKVREDLNWKIATQMPPVSGTKFSAPNLYYFMDSPTEISNHASREFDVGRGGENQKIRFVLHHNGTEEEMDTYFEKVKKTVLAEEEVFGELPQFDFGTYAFLACYVPNVSGDGMEHRNSTVLTSALGLASLDTLPGDGVNVVSHEFFHSWNVERIRPKGLEPFDFEEANMSGALWFAEGFTSYYTNLILCRAGIMSPEEYVESLVGTFNDVWNSPARQFFNPVEMSYQAPFVDAATSVDPVNRENTFISYYSYGSVLGLALDLSLRQKKLNLDDFMKLVWQTLGKTETPYTIENLHRLLKEYAGKAFGDAFFNDYIYKSDMPDYKSLLESVGVVIAQNREIPYFGVDALLDGDGNCSIESNAKIGSPAYKAGLDKGDVIISINGADFPHGQQFDNYIKRFKIGDTLDIGFERFGTPKKVSVLLEADPNYTILLMETAGKELSTKQKQNRKEWLKIDY